MKFANRKLPGFFFGIVVGLYTLTIAKTDKWKLIYGKISPVNSIGVCLGTRFFGLVESQPPQKVYEHQEILNALVELVTHDYPGVTRLDVVKYNTERVLDPVVRKLAENYVDGAIVLPAVSISYRDFVPLVGPGPGVLDSSRSKASIKASEAIDFMRKTYKGGGLVQRELEHEKTRKRLQEEIDAKRRVLEEFKQTTGLSS